MGNNTGGHLTTWTSTWAVGMKRVWCRWRRCTNWVITGMWNVNDGGSACTHRQQHKLGANRGQHPGGRRHNGTRAKDNVQHQRGKYPHKSIASSISTSRVQQVHEGQHLGRGGRATAGSLWLPAHMSTQSRTKRLVLPHNINYHTVSSHTYAAGNTVVTKKAIPCRSTLNLQ